MKISVVRYQVDSSSAASLFAHLNQQAQLYPDADVLVFCQEKIQGLDDGMLEILAAKACEEDIGAVSPLIFAPKRKIRHAGYVLGRTGDLVEIFRGVPPDFHPAHLSPPSSERRVSAVALYCFAIERTKFDAVGNFNEDFQRDFAEIDLCLRLASVGYTTCVLGSLEVTTPDEALLAPTFTDRAQLAGSLTQYHQGRSDAHFPDELLPHPIKQVSRPKLQRLPRVSWLQRAARGWRAGQALFKRGVFSRALEIQSERRSLGVAHRTLNYVWPPFLALTPEPLAEQFKNYLLPTMPREAAYDVLRRQIVQEAQEGQFIRLILLDDSEPSSPESFFELSPEAWAKIAHRVVALRALPGRKLPLTISPFDTFISVEWRGRFVLRSPLISPKQCTHYIFDDERNFFDAEDPVESEIRQMVEESLDLTDTNLKIASKSLSDSFLEKGQFDTWKMQSFEVFEAFPDVEIYREDESIPKEQILLLAYEGPHTGNRLDLALEALQLILPQLPSGWQIQALGLSTDIPLGAGRHVQALGNDLSDTSKIAILRRSPVGLYLRESSRPNPRALEHAACGALVLCNSFESLDPARLRKGMLDCSMNVEKIAQTLLKSLQLVDAALKKPYAPNVDLPTP